MSVPRFNIYINKQCCEASLKWRARVHRSRQRLWLGSSLRLQKPPAVVSSKITLICLDQVRITVDETTALSSQRRPVSSDLFYTNSRLDVMFVYQLYSVDGGKRRIFKGFVLSFSCVFYLFYIDVPGPAQPNKQTKHLFFGGANQRVPHNILVQGPQNPRPSPEMYCMYI